MREIGGLLICAVVLASCGGDRADAISSPDKRALITSMILSSNGDADIAVLAARRGQLAETRELGALRHRTAMEMRAELTRMAQHQNVPVPNGTQEPRVALKENLAILQGQLFDQAFAMATVQDLKALLATLDAAAASNDAELGQFAQKYRPSIVEQQRTANRLLNRLGGSPWPGLSP